MVMGRWRPLWGLRTCRPFRDLEEMERRFDELLGWPASPGAWRRVPAEVEWMPPIEMFEKDDKLVVKAELPGINKDEIDISVVGETMTIKGGRKTETEIKQESYYCCKRSYGSFVRSITLPSAVHTNKIEANLENGILEVTLSKAAEVKPKKVEISAK